MYEPRVHQITLFSERDVCPMLYENTRNLSWGTIKSWLEFAEDSGQPQMPFG